MGTPKNNSVIRAFEILNLISGDDRGFLPAEIANSMDMNLSTTHRFLLTLEEIGAVTRSAGNRYHLGLMVAELGRNVTRKDALAEAARPIVNSLANKYRETISLATFDGHQLEFVAWVEPKRPLSMNLRRDQPLPLHCSSIGKVIMADLPAIEREELMSKLNLDKFTENTITDLALLRKEVAKAQLEQVAYDHQEMEEGLSCLAVPVLDGGGTTIAAISISAPTSRMDSKVRKEYAGILQESANKISTALFFETKVIPGRAKPRGSYPHVKRVGDFIYISGTSARKADDSFIGARKMKSGEIVLDIYRQTTATIKNLQDILTTVDASISDLVEIEAFLIDMDHYEQFNRAYGEHFGHSGPTRTTVAVHALPHPHQILMLKAIAYVPVGLKQ